MKKTIGLFIPSTISYSETFFSSKVSGLEKSGFTVIIYCSKGNKQSNDFQYCYQRTLPKNSLIRLIKVILTITEVIFKSPSRSLRLFKFNKKNNRSLINNLEILFTNAHVLIGPKIDYIHFGFATMGIGREGLGKALKAEVSTSIRGYDIGIYPIQHPNCYNTLWENLDKLHTISDDLLRLAINDGLKESTTVKKIPPAINTKKFPVKNSASFFDKKEIKIVTVGRLAWKKGYEYALQAIRLLKDANIEIKYTIIGQGDGFERINFARHQLGLTNEVELLGKVNHELVPEILLDHDIYLQPSIQEGFCNAVLEAQAMGLLCVVTDAEGLPENVIHNKTGWVVPKRNPEAIANRIKAISNLSSEDLIMISNTAQKRVRQEFNLEIQQQRFASFFNNFGSPSKKENH